MLYGAVHGMCNAEMEILGPPLFPEFPLCPDPELHSFELYSKSTSPKTLRVFFVTP